MSDQNRDTLDKAIDQVTARMVSVEQDAAMADRIVARLPERADRAWLGVFLPQAAAAIAILVAVVIWTTREPGMERNPDVWRAGAAAPATSAPAPLVAIELAGAKAPALQTSLSRRTIEPARLPDHERGLEPVAVPVALQLSVLDGLEAGPATLAPLVLTDLPLSGESISPN